MMVMEAPKVMRLSVKVTGQVMVREVVAFVVEVEEVLLFSLSSTPPPRTAFPETNATPPSAYHDFSEDERPTKMSLLSARYAARPPAPWNLILISLIGTRN